MKIMMTLIAAMGICLAAQTPPAESKQAQQKATTPIKTEEKIPIPTLTDADLVQLLTLTADQASMVIQSQSLEKHQADLREKYNAFQQKSAATYAEITKHYKLPEGYELHQLTPTTFKFEQKKK